MAADQEGVRKHDRGWVAQKVALFSSYQSFWMSPSSLLLGCYALHLLTVPGELTEITVVRVISKAEALVCPDL